MAKILIHTPTTPTIATLRRVRANSKAWWLVVPMLATAALIAFWFITSHPAKKAVADKKPPVLTVAIQPAREEPLAIKLSVTGNISAIDPLTIGSQATGLQIIATPGEEGRYVHRGEVLAVLDSAVLRAQLEAARARLTGAQAAVPKAIQPNRPEELNALGQAYGQAMADTAQRQALLTQAQATLLNARHTAARYRTLYSQGAVSQQDLENQVVAEKTAVAGVAAAQANLQSAKLAAQQASERSNLGASGGRREDVVAARAVAAENAATVRQLQTQIEQTIIRAPDDGLITKRDAHIGDITGAGKSLFEIVRQGKLELRAQISERDISRIQVGNPATITSGAYSTTGSVWKISPTIDPGTRLGIARISIPLDAGFKPGMFARASVVSSVQTALLVPNSAIGTDGLTTHVFTYNNGTVRKRVITTGEQADGKTQILTGIQPGELVVISGAGFLNDGDPVRVGS